MTREQIEALKIGDELERTLDIVPWSDMTRVEPNARWGCRGKVVRISARDVSVKGRLYICGDTSFGDSGSTLSFSIAEGEAHLRLVPPDVAQ